MEQFPAAEPIWVYFDRFLPDAMKLSADKLETVNLNVLNVAIMCVAVGELVSANRAYFAAVPHLDISAFDNLMPLGFALQHAEAAHVARVRPKNEVRKLAVRGTELRNQMMIWARPLEKSGLIQRGMLDRIPLTNAYHDLPLALGALIQCFRQSGWPTLKKHSGLTEEMIVEASTLHLLLLEAIGRRDLPRTGPEESTDQRRRILTLCVRAYSEVQRGVTLWRWHDGDAAVKAPSLYKRGPRRKTSKKASAQAAGESQQPTLISPPAPVLSAPSLPTPPQGPGGS